MVAAFHDALAPGDSLLALSLLAEDVVILENGRSENREHYRSGHLSGDIRFAPAVTRERSGMSVQISGDVAWVHGTNITQGRIEDREIDPQGAELMVLTREVEREGKRRTL